MKKIIALFGGILVIGGVVLEVFSPDILSTVIVGMMCLIVIAGFLFGILPTLSYAEGFGKGRVNIDTAMGAQTDTTWVAVVQMGDFFGQKTLNRIFEQYQEKVQFQRNSKQLLDDIENYMNEEILALRTWQGVILQIPGTMTGLGILGTFAGLIIGISNISVSTVDATLVSIQTLLNGIRVAFYTSIAGVIFSLVFNIIYKMSWNIMVRELGLFVDLFHKSVIPSSEEQLLHRERRENQMILERLERIPKNPGYSVSNSSGGATGQKHLENEQILMPQILRGLKTGEFTFYLQPKYELNSSKVIGAEALVRWNHNKLGVVSPAIFVPVLESNGYIAKLDQYIWEEVCKSIRQWINEGIHLIPISVNVTKTDILAMDVAGVFEKLLETYKIPPRYLEVEISENAYFQSPELAWEVENTLRSRGFRVVLDSFDGNFFTLGTLDNFQADAIKLDLRKLNGAQMTKTLSLICEQARKLQYFLCVEGIENMEQLAVLRKNGCIEGQGYYFSKPITIEQFENMINGEK